MNNENLSIDVLSKLTIFSKYAKYIPEKRRRETWDEICTRVESMHIKKYPELKDDIQKAFTYVKEKKIVPSMRSMQFAGKPIELNNSRIFNCAFTAIQTWKDFSEIMLLLLGGSGVGFSVQKTHINKLPPINKPKRTKKYLIGDSIEGWADSIRALFKAYMSNGYLPLFDYSDIRPKGSALITAGGKAPGPQPLERCLNRIKSVLDKKEDNERLTSLEVHDIVCMIADAVLSGGIRRAALISFFDKDDQEMLNCKGNFTVSVLNGGFHYNDKTKLWEGEIFYKNKAYYISLQSKQFDLFLETKTLPWYWFEPQRARSNNSVVLLRNDVTKEDFDILWDIVKQSGSGEPGFFWTNDINVLSNPCGEISLKSRGFCNLTSINFSTIKDDEDFKERVWAATVIGTLQAGYTDFHYLSSKWQDNTEDEALLGVSLTGIGDNKKFKEFDWSGITAYINEVNKEYAEKIGIKPAHRITTCKPEGCLISDTVIKTNIGNKTILEIFELNGYNDIENLDKNFYDINEKIFIKNIDDEYELINKLYCNGNTNVIEIETDDGQIIVCTEKHKFLTENRGWVQAKNLNETDILLNY